ncbi:siderophore-interacting protein [Alcanivorax balearicus MACL04]|uniref:Siderophore-interacting protein n=1 Tax=Alloalcanivorax balearicus MACL04 TaxID=1177182 RepID=A0ABT2R3Z4_9GAMM|nr:siderophore-interacting protein [Alloalcanivorax balearicus]MCU5784502.1 siderophore-interacting protein [Alloalcanivorax balearicus MACL04]
MPRPAPRILEVLRTENLTPNMKRVVLGGGDLSDFPENHESANFKLLIPREGQTDIALPPYGDTPPEHRPVVRTYTLRHFDKIRGEIFVDFMMHTDHGPASHWAAHARSGDRIGFAGPGAPKFVDYDADWFLFAGDMSALPAISANIERLPAGAQGYAVLDILSPADQQPLPFPSGLEVHWRVNPYPEQPALGLVDKVMSLPWLTGSPAVWVAGESGAVRAIRRYLVQERRVERHHLYASGYWQIGLTEDAHQVAKRREQNE